MKLIIDTLEAARLTASPSVAMDLADAIADLRALDAALNGRDISEIPYAVQRFDALCTHIEARPFDVTDALEPNGATGVDELTPGAFAEWLAVLEYTAA